MAETSNFFQHDKTDYQKIDKKITGLASGNSAKDTLEYNLSPNCASNKGAYHSDALIYTLSSH